MLFLGILYHSSTMVATQMQYCLPQVLLCIEHLHDLSNLDYLNKGCFKIEKSGNG